MAGDMPIYSTYNATYGLKGDLREAHKNLNFVVTPPSRLMAERWIRHLETNGPNSTYLEILHSNATALGQNALLLMPEEYRKRIIIVAIAPDVFISRKLAKEAFNYVSQSDPVPRLQYFFGKNKDPDTSNVTYLPRHPNAKSKIDHNFDSPTYEKTIRDQIDFFLKGGYDD
jgi:hypothetical protein